ncbi:MAG TPA: class I adenylate-forming enzyme family protein, partial [Pyrinomonadaceae bacterium]
MEPRNIPELLRQRASVSPDKIFLLSEADKRQFTYREFEAAVMRVAGMLSAQGVGKGDVVSLLLPNSAEYIIAYFACWQLGALAGPVNGHLKAQEIEYVVSNSEAKLMLVNSEFLSKVESIPVPLRVFDGESAVEHEFDGEKTDQITAADEAIIIYTSGTTGKPKGCLLTHGNVIANARQISEWLGFNENDRLLTMMPLFHMNAVTVTTMSALYANGSTVVSQKFSASRFWQIISDYQITSFGSVATMLSMLLSTYPDGVPEGLKTDQLRFAMCG